MAAESSKEETTTNIIHTTFYDEEIPKHRLKDAKSASSYQSTSMSSTSTKTTESNMPAEPVTPTESTASSEPSTVSTRSTRSSGNSVEPAVSTRSTRRSSNADAADITVESTAVSTRSTRRNSNAAETTVSTRSTRSTKAVSESTKVATDPPVLVETVKVAHPVKVNQSVKAIPSDKSKKSKTKVVTWSSDPNAACLLRFMMTSTIEPHPVLNKLRTMELDMTFHHKDLPAEVPKPKVEKSEEEEIEVVKKDNIFSADVTESEMAIIKQRVARQQQMYADYEHREKIRKFKKVYSIFDYLTIEEMEEMLTDCKNDEEEVVVRMTEPMYLLEIRKAIAIKFAPVVKPTQPRNPRVTSASTMTPVQLEAYEKLISKRSSTLRKTTDDTAKKQYRLGGRLALDDALRQVEEQGADATSAFDGWSAARIRAYNLIDQNPNSYYYRFNAPGEVQRKGQWAADERKLFFDRLEEVGANGQWGHFAMTIPGRVGYQCSNFYRLLVENGEVDDPNYVLDEKGKAHYLFDKKNANGTVEKTFRTHNKHGRTGADSGSSSTAAATTTSTKRKRASTTSTSTSTKASTKRKRRNRRWGSDDDDDDDDDDGIFDDYNDNSGSYTGSGGSRSGTRSSTRRTRGNTTTTTVDPMNEEQFLSVVAQGKQPSTNQSQGDESYQEPEVLPDFIDPITLDQVVKPAISKYGHVMGYDSWVRCLTNWEGKKNICPLTKNPLSKRDLVILTYENIEEYRDKIMNM